MYGMAVTPDSKLGADAKVYAPDLVNIYGASIGEKSTIGPFVEIQRGVIIGAQCKISSHSFLCTGVTIEDDVFIGHGVMFTNDKYPRATNADGTMQTGDDWECLPTFVKKGASIGSSVVILPGITIGERAMVGAGSVVTKDVPPGAIVLGNPAKFVKWVEGYGGKA
jgi:UDP-2-acetamido-3-amino-2,3-dideoxy-glucuronate N-acetyltransferase